MWGHLLVHSSHHKTLFRRDIAPGVPLRLVFEVLYTHLLLRRALIQAVIIKCSHTILVEDGSCGGLLVKRGGRAEA